MGGLPDKPFKAIALSMVRNEQDIIEPFVRHNLRFVDYMVVIDNNSADGTRAILENLARETGRLGVYDRKDFEFTQGEVITTLLHAVQSCFFADYFVFLDADEFIGAKNRGEFEAALRTIPPLGVGRMPWRTYVLPEGQPLADMSADPPRTMTWHRRAEQGQLYKVVLRLDGKVVPNLTVAMGNHAVFGAVGQKLRSVDLSGTPLLHFPVRSEAQIAVKSIGGWMGILAKQKSGVAVGRSECHQWRENYERALQGTIGEQLSIASYFYSCAVGKVDWSRDVVQEDHGIRYERRYSNGAFGDKLALVSKAWEISIGLKAPLLPARCLDPKITGKAGFGVDLPVLRWLRDRIAPARVLELKPGAGVNLVALRGMGVDQVYGFGEAPVDQTFLSGSNYLRGDLKEVETVGGRFDMILCLGALAGFEPETARRVAGLFAARTSKAIAFLAGPIVADGNRGQDEGRDLGWWLALWRSLGWVPDVGATLAARAVANFHSLRRGLVILVPGGPDSPGDAIAFLSYLEKLRFTPAGDTPGLYGEAFSRDIQEYARGFLGKAP